MVELKFFRRKQLRIIALLFLFLCNAVLSVASAQDFFNELTQLDKIKSSDFHKFESQISEMEQRLSVFHADELAYYNFLKAYSYAYKGKYSEALLLIEPYLAANTNTVIGFRSTALAVNTLLLSRRYLDAFTYLERLINLLPQINQPIAREQGLRVIAMMYNSIDRHDLSLSYLQQLEEESPSVVTKCAAKQLKIDAMMASEQYDKVISEGEAAIQYCVQHNELLWANLIRSAQATSYLEQGNVQDAKQLIDEHYAEVSKVNYPRLQAEFDLVSAQIYQQLNLSDNAVKYAEKVLHNEAAQGMILPRVKSLLLLYQVYKTAADFKKALEYHEQYVAAFTAYMDDKSAQQMAYHTAHSEILAQSQKIALLDKDNQLLQYEQTVLKHQATFNKLLIIALVVLVLGLAVMAYRSFVARLRFKALAEYDDLTAISNRYHFSTSAKDALALCEKAQLPAALVVFDLDHFKQINDQHGHAAGDWALRQTVDTCRNFMRNNDVFGRIGGEEFAILLPGCQSDKAHLLADICRDAISNVDTAASGYEFKLSASFGVTSTELSGYHLTKLIEDADTAMYQAKQQGRNKVHFFRG